MTWRRNSKALSRRLTTPFVGDEISIPKFEENIRKYNASGLAGYLVLGSTGECVSLSDAESEALVRAARSAAAAGMAVIAGTARESTRLTVDFTNRLADTGIDAALVRAPSYFKSRMTGDALKAHFLAVADKARVPVIVYNIPANTGISLEASLIIELSAHPNIIGSEGELGKHRHARGGHPPGPARIPVFPRLGQRLHARAGDGRLRGHPWPWPMPLPSSARGSIVSSAREMIDEARKLQLDLIPLNKGVMEGSGIPGLKHALDLRDTTGARSAFLFRRRRKTPRPRSPPC